MTGEKFMKTSASLARALPLALLVGTATPAWAALPPPVRAMIDAALETEKEETVRAVLELARKTNPDSDAEIDAIKLAYEERVRSEGEQREAARIEQVRNAGLLGNWSGKGELGAFRSTGNAANTGITAGLALTREGINWRHNLSGRADYQETEGVVTREQYLAVYELNYKLSERLYAYGLAQYERDRFQGFSARYSVSGGLGYDVLTGPAITLSVKAGPAWRDTQLVDGTSSSNFAGLAAADFNWMLAETISFTQTASALVQAGSSTYISDSGLSAKVTDKVSVRLSYTVEHDTAPPPGAVQTDTLSRVTLIYDF
jgi:putative salt-induced outer membrane protein